MIVARQSTARTVTVGPVLDADGVAVTTAVVGDFKLSKNGGAPAALNGSATLTHRNTGHYSLALTASDTDTVGQAEVVIDATTNACPVKEITVVEEAVYDALFAASAVGYVADQPVNATKFGGTTVTGRDIGASVLLSSGTGTGQLKLASGYVAMTWADIAAPTTAVALTGTTIATTQKVDVETIKTQAVTCAAGVTVGVYVGGTGAAALEATAQSILTDTGTTLQGDITAILADTNELQTDWANGGRLDLIVDDILADTAVIGAAGAGLTAVPWNAAWDAEVQSEVQDAIEVNHLDHLLAADYDPASKPGVATALLNELVGSDAGVSQFTANALELAPTGGSAPTASAIADEVQTRTIAGVTLVTTVTTLTGHTPQTGDAYARLGAPAGASVSADVAAVKTQTAAIETDTQDIQSRLPAALSGGNMSSVLADGVAHGGTSARLVLGASGSDAAFDVTSTGDGGCLSLVSSGANANPLSIRHTGKTPNHAVYVDASTTTSSAAGVYIVGSAAGIYATADAGPGIKLVGGSAATGYSGFLSTGGGAAGSGMELVKAGLSTGVSLLASDGITGSITGSLSGSTGDSADIDAILEDTGTTLPAQIAALNNLSAAQVNAECDAALADAGVTTTVTGRIDAAVSTRLATASYTAPPTAAENADALIGRNIAGGSSTGRTVKQALSTLRNKVTISGGVLTVYDTDDVSVLYTAVVTSDAAADPVTSVDPG